MLYIIHFKLITSSFISIYALRPIEFISNQLDLPILLYQMATIDISHVHLRYGDALGENR